MGKTNKPGKLTMWFIRQSLKGILHTKFDLTVEQNDTIGLEPPYLILSNHVNDWDPFLINAYVKEPACFVAAESLFRYRFLRPILLWTGAIPKAKYRTDPSTIKQILKAKKNKRVIAMFPEGNRSWDGSTKPLIYSTAKLVKKLEIPVVAVKIKGGHLCTPRWSSTDRKGKIGLEFKKIFDAASIAEADIDNIHKSLTKALAYDEYAMQKVQINPYKGKRLAEHLERLLFVCPHCKTIGHLRTKDDELRCESCGYTVRYNEYGLFTPQSGILYHDNPRSWNVWQLENLPEWLANHQREDFDAAFHDKVKLYSTKSDGTFQYEHDGELHWEDKAIRFVSESGESYQFDYAYMDGLNIQLKTKLDFYYHDQFYRIDFYLPHTSAYKWLKSIHVWSQIKGIPMHGSKETDG